MDKNEDCDKHHKENDITMLSLKKNHPSLSSLILWNISKALEKNPQIDLRFAMRAVCERLERQSCDVSALSSEYPEERHVACAVLAWQQLGHKDTESLYEFIESHRNKTSRNNSDNSSRKDNICSVNSSDKPKRPKGFIDHKPSTYRKDVNSTSFDTYSLIGPVVKLPVETKIVMRMENASTCQRHSPKKSTKSDIKNKVDAACCLDSACAERLKELETLTSALRTRAGRLAHREAERAELLERAEAAWRDLELGYQRRLLLAEEKEEEIAKQIKKSIEDRNAYKHACTIIAQQLGKRGEIVENDRPRLAEVEKEVCDLACTRLRLSEEAAKGDAVVAEQQCKVIQLERDLQFKEEQARRKLLSIEGVWDSSRGLTLEAERAMREELGTIKEQIAKISTQLLEEDANYNQIKAEVDELRQQNADMIEDLEGCKEMCDNRMQGIVDDLNKKRQTLKELKDKVIECQCKVPLDVAVEVKRTPSLAALCRCTAEEHILHSCSCTSVRSTLLSNLLSDLFGGLQAELGDTGTLMPCQLLKCLEDKHNWDRASIVKSNLRNFFSQLLVGELDTAIATSIEKYHATWVGVSCADKAKVIPDQGGVENDEWQERTMERRAQKLASQLAEELFQERADQLVQKAKDIVTSGPPPCECKHQTNKTNVYPCLVKTPTIGNSNKKNDVVQSMYMKRTLQDVNLLRTQIEDLKKDTIKKEDLRIMEKKLTKIVQQVSISDKTSVVPKMLCIEDHTLRQTENNTAIDTNKTSFLKKKTLNLGLVKKNNKKVSDINERSQNIKLPGQTFKKIGQSYAVNVCLFDEKNNSDNRLQNMGCSDDFKCWKNNVSQGILPQIPSIKHSRPIGKILSKDNQNLKNRKKTSKTPLNKCTCFHKTPSNTSIDKLIETLVKWKGNLLNCSIFNTTQLITANSNDNNIKEIHHDSEFSNNKKSVNISEIPEISLHNDSNSDRSKPTKTDQLPQVTTSEYIGAINLDKSNEQFCKCNIIDEKQSNLKREKSICNNNLLFKCLDTSKCACKKKQCDGKKYKDGVKSNDENVDIKVLTDIKKFQEHSVVPNKQSSIKATRSMTSLKSQNNQTSENKLIQNDQDTLVKFLGVTLTDINNRKVCIAGRHLKKDKTASNYSSCINEHARSNFFFKHTSSNKPDKKSEGSHMNFFIDQTENRSKINQCQFLELQDGLNHIKNNKDIKNLRSYQDIGENLNEIRSCVCCHYDDDANNLEANTFYLLEKHLKSKLADFRKSSGNTFFIRPDEEEKAFLTILNRIKQVIYDCACNLKCKCSTENNASGSWTRFNSLLEEYLKMKIKKVQCSCVANKESLETVLPGVLEQVNNLIEIDLERLKAICKCQNSNDRLERNKDIKINDDAEFNEITKTMKSCNLETNTLCVVLENVSIQGSCYLGIENKSCNTIENKENKDMQTSINNFSSRSNEVFMSECGNLNSVLATNTRVDEILKSPTLVNDQPCKVKLSSDTLEKNKLTNLSSRNSLPAPYVGFTLNCSCDNNLGSCICSKSLSQSYLKNIDEIQKMVETNKNILPNISYIMHSLPKKVKSDSKINFVEVTEAYVPVIPDIRSYKYVSADEGEEIILKKSDEKVDQSDNNDNMTNTLDDLVDVQTECLNDDDTFYWYDCCISSRDTKNEIMHKKSFYDSVYSPIVELPKRGSSETSIKNNVTMCTSKSKNCDCVMVPVCHVKMLVENIEHKLANSQCTCDSLNSQVCPLHSNSLYY